LIPGEAAQDYEQLLHAVINVMKPVDFLETMWTRDVVDLQWEIIRFRRIKADVITYFYEGRCLERSVQAEISEREFRAKATKKEIASYEARCLERSAQMGEETRAKLLKNDIASVVAFRIDALEHIDRMLMTMEARRNAAYREVERHRIGLGERLRRAVEQVEDAEFREVDETTTIVPHDTTDKGLAEPAQRARQQRPEICDR
jgi:hypothetical protein